MSLYLIDITTFFRNHIEITTSNKYTKTYILDILLEKLRTNNDFSKTSITILYKDAVETYSFEKFKNIGDWLFFVKSIYPEHLCNASDEYYIEIARKSYYTCYSILNGEWLLYEELADDFASLTSSLNSSIRFGNLSRSSII